MIRYIALAAAASLLAGCATTNPNPASTNSQQQPERKREATEALGLFVGSYVVTDSRRNSIKATSATLTLEKDVPVMRFLNSDGQAVLEMRANDCSGDIKNKFSGLAFLACQGGKPLYGGMPNLFTIEERAAGHIQKTGSALIPDNLVLKDGLLVTFIREGEKASPSYLSVRRETPGSRQAQP